MSQIKKTAGTGTGTGTGTEEPSIEFVERIKKRWMATVDAIIDPLMLIDKDYNVIQANRALATKANKEVRQVVGAKCFKMFAGRDSPCPGCKLQDAFQNDDTKAFELNAISGGRSYEVTAQPIHEMSGNVEGVLNVYRDRTLAKQLQTQLIQNEKLASIGLLAGGIAHELNNPLAGILLFSQMLLRTVAKDAVYYQDVEEIENAAKRCKAIVDSLLDFARQQPTGKSKETTEIIVINEALASALRFSTVGGQANNYDVNEEFNINEPFKTVANRNRIIQVFVNLIRNALQAMPNGGTLTLRSRQTDDHMHTVVDIEDTGVGISAANLKKIFDPFFTSKPEGEGTGLGLSICHGIIEEIGGRIEVKSKVKKGTTFSIYFPNPNALSAAV
ncbi:MAG: ATP-binding protein [Bdellovibrionota bacterium]